MEEFEELVDPPEMTYEVVPEEKVYRFRLTGGEQGPASISYRLKAGEKLPHIKELQNKGNFDYFEIYAATL